MWENLKKAWKAVKSVAFAAKAWVEEIVSKGDIDRANDIFQRTFKQKYAEYTAGDILGSTAATLVRNVVGVHNKAESVIDNVGRAFDKLLDTPSTHHTKPTQNDKRREEQEQQKQDRAKHTEKNDGIRKKYGLTKRQDPKQQALNKKKSDSWKKQTEEETKSIDSPHKG